MKNEKCKTCRKRREAIGRRTFFIFHFSFCILTTAGQLRGQEISVHAGDVIARPSRHLTGACIEDVNHEIYGGLYSQMIFGESFQEPSAVPPVKGFVNYGGTWTLHGAS